MKRILLFFVLFSLTAYSQQDVFSRSEVSTGNWWDGANPWYYATWGNSQQRPDLTLPTRNYVKIGHNNNLTMTTNGAFFTLASLDFQSGASNVRTINSGGVGTGISFTLGIYNASSATHVINTEIGVDASTVQFQANGTGGLSFGNTIYINSNTAEFGGGSNIAVSGKLTGSGGKLTKVGAGTLTLSNAANDYSGVTNVNAGTLVVQKGGHSASITTGAIAFTFASTSQAAGVYDFLPGQLGGSTSRTLTSNLVGGKTISFNYATGDVTICDVMTVTSASIASNNANSSSLAKSGDVITLSFTTSEAASITPSVSINGNAATVTGSGSSWSATKTVVGGDANGVVTFSISYQNAFGCTGNGNTITDGSSVTIDTLAPIFGTTNIVSNNANTSSYAKVGDVITLNFTTSETPAVSPTASINGNAATVTGGGTSWSATKTVVGGDTNGIATFSIGIRDAAGNTTTQTSTTDGSSVTIDTTLPSFSSVTIASNNAGSASVAVPGDIVTLSFTTSESLSSTPTVLMNGVSASVSGSGTSWSATTTVLTCSGSVVSFSISISDITGNTGNTTATTNGSQVTISAQVATPSFTTGATLVCQDASDETYTATAANATEITYSVSPPDAGTIGSLTGIMNWDAGFSGDATITASAAGCGGPLTVDRVVTVQTRYSFFVDADGDGFGSTTTSMECSSSAAVAPTGFATNDEDCDDLDQDINPDATEVNFNGEDEDCDGSIFNGHDEVVSNVTPPSGALAAMTTPITCSVATNTAPYSGASVVHKFRVTRTSPPAAPVEFESATRTFAISSLAIAAYAATYEVQATAIVNGEEQPYNGNTATYTTPAAPVITTVSQISNNQCNQTLTAINSYIYASNGPASTQLYDFEVIREEEGVPTHTQVYTTTSPYFRLTSLSMPATYGTVYKVRSRYGYNSFGSEIRSSYSTQCTITTPSMPTVQVVGTQCGQTLASINAYVYSTAGLGSANLYEFKVTRIVAPGETAPAVIEETIPRIVPYFRLTMLENLFIGLGKEYSVSVRYRVNTPGVTPSIQFSDWSPVVCSVFTPEFPTTGIVDAQCNLIDFTPSMSQYIYSGIVTGATQYRFRLELFDELSETPEVPVYSQSVDSANNYITLNQFTGLSSSTTYVITVSVELYGEFGLFGKDCAVTTPDFGAKTATDLVSSSFEATAYPNPFANNFTLGVKTSSQSSIGVKVFDMVGRLVDQNSLNVAELKNATIGDQYPSGVYNVVITQDGVVKTLRVVKR